jgi:putative lumazine-binding protein
VRPLRQLAALGVAALAACSLASCRPNSEPSSAAVERAVRGYVAALDAGSGRRVCAIFEPGALDALRLPKRAGSCAGSVAASIGYRDPRGYPVWRRTRIERVRSIALRGRTARATVTMRTTFADRRQPSIEDDVIYLARHGGGWRVVKPSATFYRAIGAASPPLSSLAPPTD